MHWVQRVTEAAEQRSSTGADKETARGAHSHVHIYARVHCKGHRGQYRHAILRALAGATALGKPPHTPSLVLRFLAASSPVLTRLSTMSP